MVAVKWDVLARIDQNNYLTLGFRRFSLAFWPFRFLIGCIHPTIFRVGSVVAFFSIFTFADRSDLIQPPPKKALLIRILVFIR